MSLLGLGRPRLTTLAAPGYIDRLLITFYCMRLLRSSLLFLLGLTGIASSDAESVAVAVAANFYAPMDALVQDFEIRTDHDVMLISGSTGGLYAQIVNGAPYDVFIAADARRPALLATSGLGVVQSQITVALGQLVLWTADRDLIDGRDLSLLRDSGIRFLAIANPDLAPYGEAARQALVAMNLWERWTSRLVYGENVAQAYAMVATGNAEFGLIARSQISGEVGQSGYLLVPQTLYEPIRQDAILLERGAGNTAAITLLEFLSTAEARTVIRSFGYRLAD
ncbi:MAG: molybdate ABC transporter substrate-binding protein [Gammaproteobacteria bacterium]|nr:molybdate ABC transporter substrate-binding protein [Gammaproteobacteria bacterium]MCZ6585724.1 molybdate ABC transporter substrate-binding protein [Gammaproteobacteria bacterium]